MIHAIAATILSGASLLAPPPDADAGAAEATPPVLPPVAISAIPADRPRPPPVALVWLLDGGVLRGDDQRETPAKHVGGSAGAGTRLLLSWRSADLGLQLRSEGSFVPAVWGVQLGVVAGPAVELGGIARLAAHLEAGRAWYRFRFPRGESGLFTESTVTRLHDEGGADFPYLGAGLTLTFQDPRLPGLVAGATVSAHRTIGSSVRSYAWEECVTTTFLWTSTTCQTADATRYYGGTSVMVALTVGVAFGQWR